MFMQYKRTRSIYVILLLCIIVAGLYSRSAYSLPSFLKEYAGDVLWSAMVYVVVILIVPSVKASYVLCFTFVVSVFIECTQLLDVSWLVYLRSTPMRYLLGQGFVWSDILCYSIGSLCIFLLDVFLLNIRKRKEA